MDPKEELIRAVCSHIEKYFEKYAHTSNHNRQISDELGESLRNHEKFIGKQLRKKELLLQEDVKRLSEEQERIQSDYKHDKDFIDKIKRSIGKKPSEDRSESVDDAHSDEDGGHGTNDANTPLQAEELYPTSPSSHQGSYLSQSKDNLSSNKNKASSKQKNSSPGARYLSRSEVGTSHSSRRKDKQNVEYPDIRTPVTSATDHKTYQSPPETPAPGENISVHAPIEVSSSGEDSPSCVKNPARKRKTRENRMDRSGSPDPKDLRRSARPKVDVHYTK
jgi:hypothetical protein